MAAVDDTRIPNRTSLRTDGDDSTCHCHLADAARIVDDGVGHRSYCYSMHSYLHWSGWSVRADCRCSNWRRVDRLDC